MYLYRDYFKANVYTIWVHEPLGYGMMLMSSCPWGSKVREGPGNTARYGGIGGDGVQSNGSSLGWRCCEI